MLTKAQEILTKVEVTEGVPDYAAGKTALEASDGLLALDLDFSPAAELEESDVASGTLDTAAATVGLETASVSFGSYLRGQGMTTVPEFDDAIRACGMTREALSYCTLTANLDGGKFLHGDQFLIAEPTAISITAATAASECVITTAAHGLPTGASVPVVITGTTFPDLPELQNTINGAYEGVVVSTTTIRLTGVDTTGGDITPPITGTMYIPPIEANCSYSVGTTTTCTVTVGASGDDYVPAVGSTIDVVPFNTGVVALDGVRATATVTAVVASTSISLSIPIDSTGGTPTPNADIVLIPTCRVAGEYGTVANDDKLVFYDAKGTPTADAKVGAFGSKATATVKTGTSVTAGGYRYRPVGDRTFTMVVDAWTNTAPPTVGQILTRRNGCGAYGRVIAISSDGLTVTYEPYGEAFAQNDGVRIVQGNGQGETATVQSVADTGGPSLTFELRTAGLIHTYTGSRGTFTVNYEVGSAIRIDFEFQGLKYANPVDSVAAGVVEDESGKIRFLQGFSRTRDLSGTRVCDFDYEIQTAAIALNREPTQKPDASSASGVRSYRHQQEYIPEVTMDPSYTPVGVHPFYKNASDGLTFPQLFGAGSQEGNRVLTYCPAVQYTVSSFGDRDGERTVDFSGLARKSAGDDAVQIFVY